MSNCICSRSVFYLVTILFQSGNGSIVLDITIRVYHDDVRFDVVGDRIYRFNCSTDTILPRVQTLSKEFKYVSIPAVVIY